MNIESFNEQITQFNKNNLAIIFDDISDSERAVFVSSARDITEDIFNTILTHSMGGITQVAISHEKAFQLELQPLRRPTSNISENSHSVSFCTTVDAREGIKTGISVHDRVTTLNLLGSSTTQARQLVKPGHVFPLIVAQGGVLVKNDLPEACYDFINIANVGDAAVVVEIFNNQGDYLSIRDQIELAENLKINRIGITDIIKYRLNSEKLVHLQSENQIYNEKENISLNVKTYHSAIFSRDEVAFVYGDLNQDDTILTRIQSENTLADIFDSSPHSTNAQLNKALELIKEKGSGVIIYLRNDDALNSAPMNKKDINMNAPSFIRDYGIGAQILSALNVKKINLLSNSSRNLVGLSSYGVKVESQTKFDY